MAKKAWGARFDAPTSKQVEAFTESISVDRRLAPYDIAGSIVHARMLADQGLVTRTECRRLCREQSRIAKDIASGKIASRTELEDIHMHVEKELVDRLGDVGRKLHAGRSRNDQVVTDLKLWMRDAIDTLDGQATDLQRAFVSRAAAEQDIVLPGYTHLQRAQPVLAAHYHLAYVEKLARDRQRLADCRRRVNVLPLGGAALAGTSLPTDREVLRRELGFAQIADNSLDIAGDRDFCLEFVFVLGVIALHLAGWADEWILWSTTEFGFLRLPDAVCTGSSIMPQKKNPDVLELIRGRAARVHGDLTTLVTLVKGLPLAYNRDLQEDKRPVFDAADTVSACLELAAVIVQTAAFDRARIEAGLERGFLDATALAEYLVRKGVPFRSAHEAVGTWVRRCERAQCALADLDLDELRKVCPAVDDDVYECLGARGALEALRSRGSSAPREVRRQVTMWKKRLGC